MAISADTLETGEPDLPAPKPFSPRVGTMKFAFASGSRPLVGYTIKRGIGRGGFGEVYFAISDAGKEVALKKIERNFEVELRGVAQCLNLRHSNLVELYDVKYDDQEEPWVVMEYIAGRSLKEILDANPQGLPRDEIGSWFRGIAAGVAYLHDHGIVHRDLKPGNIFDDAGTVKIGDYGLSKYISSSRRSGHTESVGTCHYMAPEIGKGEYGKEIDLYALGVILFEMLTGRVPFEGESSQEVLMKHLTDEPDLESVAAEFRPVIAKALRKDSEQRYRTIDAMLAEFDAAIEPGAGHLLKEEISTEPLEVLASSAGSKSQLPVSFDSAAGAKLPQAQPPVRPFSSAKEPPLYIGEPNEGIELGPVKHGPGKAPPLSRPGVSAPVRSTRGTAGQPAAAPRPTVTPLAGLGAMRSQPARPAQRPLPHRSSTGLAQAGLFLSGSVIVAILAVLGVILASFPNLASWAAIAGCAYFIYAFRQQFVQLRQTHEIRITATSPALVSLESIGRQMLRMRTPWERWGELSGSFLSATLVSAALCLIMTLVTGKFSLEPIALNFLMWLILSSVLSAWIMLTAGKLWEPETGEPWQRRVVILLLGLATGVMSWVAQSILLIDLYPGWQSPSLLGTVLPSIFYVTSGAPSLVWYLAYFGFTYALVGWWKLTDPLRTSQLSISSVIGVAFAALIFPFPQPWGLTIAASTAIAVQFAASWLSHEERRGLELRSRQSHSST